MLTLFHPSQPHRFVDDGPQQTCDPPRLTSTCDLDCCLSLAQDTVGLWLLSARATRDVGAVNHPRSGSGALSCQEGTCSYTRDRNTDAGCVEEYQTTVRSAAFRDATQNLGAAVMMGPACKWVQFGTRSEWDRPASNALSAELFAMSFGSLAALQFDGVANLGLVVSNNIDQLTHKVAGTHVEKLPKSQLSVEIWFTLAKEEVLFAGLAGVLQDGTRCQKVRYTLSGVSICQLLSYTDGIACMVHSVEFDLISSSLCSASKYTQLAAAAARDKPRWAVW